MSKTPPAIRPNLLDRAIAVVDPVRASHRLMARARIATFEAMSGGYNAARRSRTQNSQWRAPDQSADAALLPDLPSLRDASRDLVRNAPLAAGAINTVVTNVVGTGIRLRASIDREALGLSDEAADAWERAAEREWKLFAENQECDLARSQDFYGLQDLAFRSTLEAGDCFALMRFTERLGSPYGLKIQLLEGDRISNPNRARDSATRAGGVELDPATGAPVGYWIANKHPGDGLPGAVNWSMVEAFGKTSGKRQILHLYRPLRPEQRRGVPYLAPVVETLKQLTRYTDAEIMAAVITSCFAIVTKTEGGMGAGFATEGVKDQKGEPIRLVNAGQIVDLGPNESLENFSPERPNAAFDPFVLAVLRQVGVALELPYEILIKHFTASYSAARAALLEVWKFFRTRRGWLVGAFCQPTYESFLVESVARGRLIAPGFFADPAIARAWSGAEWTGPSAGQISPTDEADAAAIMVEHGWKTNAEVTAELTGGDWEQKNRQRAKEEKLRAAGGLPPPGGARDPNRSLPSPRGPSESFKEKIA